MPGPGQELYTVAGGDTGWSIAQKKYGDGTYWPAIGKANPGVDANRLHPGQKLVLPTKAEVESTIRTARTGSSSSTTRPAGRSTETAGTTPRTGSTPVGFVPGRPYFGPR